MLHFCRMISRICRRIGQLYKMKKKSHCRFFFEKKRSHCRTSHIKNFILTAPRRSLHQVCKMPNVDADTTFLLPNRRITRCTIIHSSRYYPRLVSGPTISWIHPTAFYRVVMLPPTIVGFLLVCESISNRLLILYI